MTRLTRNLLIVASAGGVLAASLTAGMADDNRGKRGDRAEGPRNGGFVQMLSEIDADSNDAISNAEMQAFLTKKFDEADADGNDSVTAAEIGQTMNGRRGAGRAQGILVRFDVDSSGAVSRTELTDRAAQLFAWIDVDASGSIEKDEMPMHRGGGKRGHR